MNHIRSYRKGPRFDDIRICRCRSPTLHWDYLQQYHSARYQFHQAENEPASMRRPFGKGCTGCDGSCHCNTVRPNALQVLNAELTFLQHERDKCQHISLDHYSAGLTDRESSRTDYTKLIKRQQKDKHWFKRFQKSKATVHSCKNVVLFGFAGSTIQ
jgi:hypothetical protein